MSGKFMNVKKVILPMLTVLIITSQLLGCSSVSKSEMQYLLEQGTEVELTIATHQSDTGDIAADQSEAKLLWKQLASLETSPEIRKAWDDTLSITLTDTGKNGMLYVDAEGNNENNNTLRVALHNREFQKAIAEDSFYFIELSQAVMSQYADIDAEDYSKALHIGINDYFNLLPGTEGYANADHALNRAQFMAMVMRSETPVSDDIALDESFTAAVGHTEFNIYAQEVADYSYLTIEDGSLDTNTYTAAMTRGEAVYLLMNKYFHDELQSIDTKNITLEDAKDAGNILTEKQASEYDDDAYIALKYAVDHADDGAPTSIYKSLCLAVEKGIISSETRWDESLTMADAIDMLVKTLQKETGIAEFNFKQGKVSGHEVNLEDNSNKTPTGADITGVDYTGEATNDEYDERIHGEEAQKEQDKKRQEALDEIEGSQEYKDLIQEIFEERYGNGGGTIHLELTEEEQGRISSSGDADPSGYSGYGQGDYSGLEGGSLQ